MKGTLGKIAIFACGAAVGGVISAIITRNIVDKTYREAADEEIYNAWQKSKERSKGYQERIKDLEEKVSQQNVTIKTLADQVRKAGDIPVESGVSEADDDAEDDPRRPISTGKREPELRKYSAYSRKYSSPEPAEETEFPRDDDPYHPEEVEQILSKSEPYVITEDEFSTGCMDHSKEDIHYFMYDGKVLDEDYENIDDYARIIGEGWRDLGRRAGDEVYVRNDYLASDYRVIFTAGAGENNMNMSDIWDD